MNNASQGGSGYPLAHDDLWYCDRLPPTARQALANAAFSWGAGYFYNRWNKGKRGFKNGQDIARQVASADASVIKKRKT
jgi:hypothetical protein